MKLTLQVQFSPDGSESTIISCTPDSDVEITVEGTDLDPSLFSAAVSALASGLKDDLVELMDTILCEKISQDFS